MSFIIDALSMDKLDAKGGSIYVIVNMYRCGSLSFVTELEYFHYPPGTDRNDEFNVFYLTYGELPHCIIEIPSRDLSLLNSEAKRHGFKVVNGKPAASAYSEFRLNCSGDQCYTIETELQQSLQPADHRALIEQERRQVANFIRSFESKN